jgi:hypothetical protein
MFWSPPAGGGTTSTTTTTAHSRAALDRLFQYDALLSMMTGLLGVAVPHVLLIRFFVVATTEYNHHVHEVVRCVVREKGKKATKAILMMTIYALHDRNNVDAIALRTAPSALLRVK